MKLTKVKIAIAAAILVPSSAFAYQASQTIEPEPIKVVKQEKKEVRVEEPETIPVEVEETVDAEPVRVEKTEPAPTPQPAPAENPYGANSPMGYVYDKRKSIGKSYGKWGMARLWPTAALSQGVPVDTTPQYGDIMVMGDVVYFVESVTEDSINVSTSLDAQVQNISMLKSDLANRPQIRYIH